MYQLVVVSRYSITLLEWARAHHIHIYMMLPNCTSMAQPLDVSVYGPFKRKLRESMNDNMAHGIIIDKRAILRMIIDAWNHAATKDNIVAGWRAT